MSIKTICQNALKEIGSIEVPNTFVTSQNPTAIGILAALRREGHRLERKYRWVELVDEHTFTTVADQATYARPTDFRRFANMSQWDRLNLEPLNGPTSAAQWQFLKSSIVATSAGITRWFRIKGVLIYIHPTPPTAGDTIAFDYYSKNWITKQSDSTTTDEFESDNDTTRLDPELLTLGAKFRFMKAKGISWEAEYREYEDMIEALQADNGGSQPLSLNAGTARRNRLTNIPDTGYGLS